MLGVLAATLFLSLIGRGQGGPDKALLSALGMSRRQKAVAYEFLVVLRISHEFMEGRHERIREDDEPLFDPGDLKAHALANFENVAIKEIYGYLGHDVLGVYEGHLDGEPGVWIGALVRLNIEDNERDLVDRVADQFLHSMPEVTSYWEGFDFAVVRGQGPSFFWDLTPTPEEAMAMEGRALLGIPEPFDEEGEVDWPDWPEFLEKRRYALIWQNLSKRSDNV